MISLLLVPVNHTECSQGSTHHAQVYCPPLLFDLSLKESIIIILMFLVS